MTEPVAQAQAQIDVRNAAFWDELCGTTFARSVGISDASPQSLARFDAAYLDFYPYLEGYLPPPGSSGLGSSRTRVTRPSSVRGCRAGPARARSTRTGP